MEPMTTSDLRDDLSDFEADFATETTATETTETTAPAAAAPATPALPQHLVSAARRRAEDEARGYRDYAKLHVLGISGLIVSMTVLGLVSFHTPA
jgi:hypothetical protein